MAPLSTWLPEDNSGWYYLPKDHNKGILTHYTYRLLCFTRHLRTSSFRYPHDRTSNKTITKRIKKCRSDIPSPALTSHLRFNRYFKIAYGWIDLSLSFDNEVSDGIDVLRYHFGSRQPPVEHIPATQVFADCPHCSATSILTHSTTIRAASI